MKTVELIERIEGEAKLHCTWHNNKISNARIDFLNFRGFEYILEGKNPLDALIYTPRVCGICGQAHLKATVEALEGIYEDIDEKIEISNKAKFLREIGLNIEIIDSHIKWFYMFIIPDIIALNNRDLGKYEPMKGSLWIEASKTASETIKALALIGGQWPHTSYMIPGGVVCEPTQLELSSMINYLDNAINFYEKKICGISFDNYLSLSSVNELDSLEGDLKVFRDISFEKNMHNLGLSHGNFITLGRSESFKIGKIRQRLITKLDYLKVKESSDYTFEIGKSDNKKHTWSKNVTYDNSFFETGPLARALTSNRKFIKDLHKNFSDSIYTRVMARMDELAYLLDKTKALIKQVDIHEPSMVNIKTQLKNVKEASSLSAVEACRGSLIHDIKIKNGKIDKYNIITPTVWNLGPQNEKDYGVAQKAIIGLDSIELAKIALRSFDVCSVCTSH